MLGVVIGLIAFIELCMAVILFKNYIKTDRTMTLCVLLICAGLIIDAFFIAIGGLFEDGLPRNVSRIRFLAHGALIPLLFPISGYGLKLSNKVMGFIWGLTAVLSILGIAHAFALNLELTEAYGVLRHTASYTSPVWATIVSSILSFGTVIPLILSGLVVWAKQKNVNLFLSGLLMFLFSAAGPATGRFDLIFFISMFGEVFMILFAMLYIRQDEVAESRTESTKAA